MLLETTRKSVTHCTSLDTNGIRYEGEGEGCVVRPGTTFRSRPDRGGGGSSGLVVGPSEGLATEEWDTPVTDKCQEGT